jgi:hypothetical protein
MEPGAGAGGIGIDGRKPQIEIDRVLVQPGLLFGGLFRPTWQSASGSHKGGTIPQKHIRSFGASSFLPRTRMDRTVIGAEGLQPLSVAMSFSPVLVTLWLVVNHYIRAALHLVEDPQRPAAADVLWRRRSSRVVPPA